MDNQITYLFSIAIILVTLFIAVFTKKILRLGSKISSRTKTKIDEIIIEHIGRPLQLLILTIGLFAALKYTGSSLIFKGINLLQVFATFWIIAMAYLVASIVKALFSWYTEELQHKLKKSIDDTLFKFMIKVINFSIYVIAFGIILNRFGIEITPLLAGLGIAGLAVGLALKDTLANLFSALYITVDRPMKIGDYIEVAGGLSGYVADIGWRSTRLRTWDNNYIILPNAKIAESIVKNFNAPKYEMIIPILCGVSYDVDLDKVEKLALGVAKKIQKSEGAVHSYEPTVRFYEFGDSAINFKVFLKVKQRANKSEITHKFIKELKKSFDRNNIEIPFPQRDVHMKK